MEERILVRSITDVYGDPRGVRLTLASNIRDTAEDLVRLDNTVTGGSSQNSTRKYVGSKGTGLSKTSVLGMLKKTDSFTSATEAWVKEAGVKIEANHADLYATKTAITGSWKENVENIDALITATTDNGGLVAMIVGRKTKTEEINAAIKATTEGGGLITLKADATVVTSLGKRVSGAEIAIDGANSQITLKADKVDVDALITEVNGLKTGGVKAKALHTERLVVTEGYIHIGDKDGTWNTLDVCTGVHFSTTNRYCKSPSDVTITIKEISNVWGDFETIRFLGGIVNDGQSV